MLKRKLCRVISTTLLMFMLVIQGNAYANDSIDKYGNGEQSIIQPYFTNIVRFENGFDISASGKASVSVYFKAQNVDSVRVDANLQQYKNGAWVTIKSWTNTSEGTDVGLNKEYYVAKGYSYRLASEGKAYIDGSLVERTSYVSQTINY